MKNKQKISKICRAIKLGNLENFKKIYRDLDKPVINACDTHGFNLLDFALCHRAQTEIIKFLLKDKTIRFSNHVVFSVLSCKDVNLFKIILHDRRLSADALNCRDKRGCCPLYYAFAHNLDDIVKVLLSDYRVQLNIPLVDSKNLFRKFFFPAVFKNTALDCLLHLNHADWVGHIIKRLEVSDKINVQFLKNSDGCTALHLVMKDEDASPFLSKWVLLYSLSLLEKNPKLTSVEYYDDLLENAYINPTAMMDKIHALLEVCVNNYYSKSKQKQIAALFALIIFKCEGLLEGHQTDDDLVNELLKEKYQKAIRFFNIAERLPIELQMELCHRVADSSKTFILALESETAFKGLASALRLH